MDLQGKIEKSEIKGIPVLKLERRADDTKVEILDDICFETTLHSYDGWDKALHAARVTQNPNTEWTGEFPSEQWKKRLLYSEHSPLREPRVYLTVEMYNKSQNHLVRHSTGMMWYISTLRTDLKNSNDVEVHRLTERTAVLSINLAGLLQMARTRLCFKTEEATRKVMKSIVDTVVDADPTLFMEGNMFYPDCSRCRENAFSDCMGTRLSNDEIDRKLGMIDYKFADEIIK